MKKEKHNNKTHFVYFGKAENFDTTESIRYWQSRTPYERFVATVKMSEEVAEMKGIKNVERFLRSVALFKPVKS